MIKIRKGDLRTCSLTIPEGIPRNRDEIEIGTATIYERISAKPGIRDQGIGE
jgi:hypothetical protein